MIFEKIQQLAIKKNVSIYRIEQDLQLGNGTIGKWSTSKPLVSTLKKVADYLEVSISELMEE